MVKNYNLFISHSWSYSDHYDRLVYLLNSRPYFSYRNYSVPKDDPIHTSGSDSRLREAIRQQMAHASVVLILAGVYSTYSRWINIEVDLAKHGFGTPKKIIAIQPWGSDRTSRFVKENADIVVNWNTESIVKAIRQFG